jgi:hypothetical protein
MATLRMRKKMDCGAEQEKSGGREHTSKQDLEKSIRAAMHEEKRFPQTISRDEKKESC